MLPLVSAMQLRPYDLFGLGVTSQEIRDLTMLPRWNHDTLRRVNHQVAPVAVGKDGYQVSIDVQQFRPNEITVKTVDNTVIVEGKHEERQDEHGYIARHFMRKYTLPKGYNSNEVTSSLSSDGILTIMAPKPKLSSATNERVVPIQHTGPAHLHVKDNAAADDQQEKKENSK